MRTLFIISPKVGLQATHLNICYNPIWQAGQVPIPSVLISDSAPVYMLY